MNMQKAPVALTAYGRASTILQTLRRLLLCHGVGDTDVYLFMDAAANEKDEERVAHAQAQVLTFKNHEFPRLQVTIRERNLGARGNITRSVSEVIETYGRAVVLDEDTLVSAPFLQYMNEALALYEGDPRIWCINGYQHPNIRVPRSYRHDVYLSPRNMAWGFGVWRDRWRAVDFDLYGYDAFVADHQMVDGFARRGADMCGLLAAQHAGRIDTWDIQCSLLMFQRNLFAIEPRKSLTKNIGFSSGGRHCSKYEALFARQPYYDFQPRCVPNIQPDATIISQFEWLQKPRNVWSRILRRLRREMMKYAPQHMTPIPS